MKRFLVGGCAALLVTAACSDDPSLYLGGPAGPAVRIQLSGGTFSMKVGDQVTIGAVALDAVGNVTGDTPTFAACGGSPVAVASATAQGLYTAAATIQAAASAVGAGCVLVTAAGLTDSVHVNVGPAGLTITGPATVLSGSTEPYTASGFDAAGAAVSGTPVLEWASSSKATFVTEFLEALVSGRSPGTASLRVRGAGGVNASMAVTVAPGAFSGTLSANSGAPGLVITATRGASDDEFDANSAASYGGQAAWIELASATSLRVALPATGSATAQNLLFTGLGPNQTAKQITVTSTSAFDDQYGSDTDTPATAPGYTAERSAGNWVYFTHSGFGTGAASRGLLNGSGGTQQDHYFLFSTGASGGTISEARLEWTNAGAGADHDLLICTVDFLDCPGEGFSGNNANEVITNVTLAPNTDYFVAMTAWTSRNNIHNFRLRLAGTGIN